jgi:hypothetical protein
MIDLTPDARRRFDEYLQRTRSALRGTRAVEMSEIEQNVMEILGVGQGAELAARS